MRTAPHLESPVLALALGSLAALATFSTSCATGTTDQPSKTEAEAERSWDEMRFTEITNGFEYACGIRTSGRLHCWGESAFGQASPPDGKFTDISAGRFHACGVTEGNRVKCWGLGEDPVGSLDKGPLRVDVDQAVPPSDRFTQVSAATKHSCALGVEGDIECWGSDKKGLSTPPSGDFVDVDVTLEQSCAVTESGKITCWGDTNRDGMTAPSSGRFVEVDIGDALACGRTNRGAITCWGIGWHESKVPSAEFTDISVETLFGCGCTRDHRLRCWELGERQSKSNNRPDGRFHHVSLGYRNTCALRKNGKARCWRAVPIPR